MNNMRKLTEEEINLFIKVVEDLSNIHLKNLIINMLETHIREKETYEMEDDTEEVPIAIECDYFAVLGILISEVLRIEKFPREILSDEKWLWEELDDIGFGDSDNVKEYILFVIENVYEKFCQWDTDIITYPSLEEIYPPRPN